MTDLATQYQRKTDKQHVLDNPDTYIGSVEKVDSEQWILDTESNKFVLKSIEYVPGLYKLFDEGIVNDYHYIIKSIYSSIKDLGSFIPINKLFELFNSTKELMNNKSFILKSSDKIIKNYEKKDLINWMKEFNKINGHF